MTTDDHATHALSARIRALADTRPRKSLLDALAFEAVKLERHADAEHALSVRLRYLSDSEVPSGDLLDGLAIDAEILQRRADDARARVAEDDGMTGETRVPVHVPSVPMSAPPDDMVYKHG